MGHKPNHWNSAGSNTTPDEHAAAAAVVVTVLTYNVNFGEFIDGTGGGENARLVLEAIVEADADIVCLQETNHGWQRFLATRLRREYPTQHWLDPNDHYYASGCAFLCKDRVEVKKVAAVDTARSVDGSYFDQQVALLNVQHNDGKSYSLAVGNVHLRPPLAMGEEGGEASSWRGAVSDVNAYLNTAGRVHEAEIDAVLRACESEGEVPTVIVGDFNEGNWGRGVARLSSAGFIDAARNATTWNWPLLNGWINLTGSYDHIFCREPEISITNVDVMDRYLGASDHLPVLAEL